MKGIFLFILLFFAQGIGAQLNSTHWLFSLPRYEPTLVDTLPPAFVSHLKVLPNQEPKILQLNQLHSFMGGSSACVFDTNNQLMFYSNGISVFDKTGAIMEGGDSINYSKETARDWSYAAIRGPACMKYPASSFVLQDPDRPQLYYFIHEILVGNFNGHFLRNFLFYSQIDMAYNNGVGKVIKKNVLLSSGLLGNVTPVRHGNNKDWWIIMPDYLNKGFQIYLLSQSGIKFYKFLADQHGFELTTEISSYFPNKISSDGRYYAKVDLCRGISLYEIDRCEFELKFKANINFYYQNTLIRPCGKFTGDFANSGVEFSPDSKLLYVSNFKELYQYAIEDIIINKREEPIFKISQFQLIEGCALFAGMQLAADGKIYIGGYPYPTSCIHRINRPNLKGTSCDFMLGYINTTNLFETPIQYKPIYYHNATLKLPCDTIR